MATVVRIDDILAREATQWAERTGRSLGQFVEDAVAGELLARPVTVRTDAVVPGPVTVVTFGGDGIVDGLTLAKAVARAELEADAAVADRIVPEPAV
jgi:hypothetical protein